MKDYAKKNLSNTPPDACLVYNAGYERLQQNRNYYDAMSSEERGLTSIYPLLAAMEFVDHSLTIEEALTGLAALLAVAMTSMTEKKDLMREVLYEFGR